MKTNKIKIISILLLVGVISLVYFYIETFKVNNIFAVSIGTHMDMIVILDMLLA